MKTSPITFEAIIFKLDSEMNEEFFISQDFENESDAIEFLNNTKNHPVIDCAGYHLELNGKLIGKHIYGA